MPSTYVADFVDCHGEEVVSSRSFTLEAKNEDVSVTAPMRILFAPPPWAYLVLKEPFLAAIESNAVGVTARQRQSFAVEREKLVSNRTDAHVHKGSQQRKTMSAHALHAPTNLEKLQLSCLRARRHTKRRLNQESARLNLLSMGHTSR